MGVYIIGIVKNWKGVARASLAVALASTITLIGLVAYISVGLSASFFLLLVAALIYHSGETRNSKRMTLTGIALALVSLAAVLYFVFSS